MHRESNCSSIYIIYRIMYMRIGWHLKSVMMYSPASLGGWHWHWWSQRWKQSTTEPLALLEY